MSQKLPYEKLIAEKMQELPVPDAEASWRKMKHLLDDEMPFGGGSKKRPGGGWWWKGGLIALISAGTGALIYSNARDGAAETVATVEPSEQTIDISATTKPAGSIDQNATQLNKEENKQATAASGRNNVQYNDFVDASAGVKTSLANTEGVTKDNVKKNSSANGSGQPLKQPTMDAGSKRPGNKPPVVAKQADGILPSATFTSNEVNKPINPGLISADARENNGPPFSNSAHTTAYESDSSSVIMSGWQSAADHYYVMATVPNENILYSMRLPAISNNLSVPERVQQLPDVTAEKKAILKEQRRQERKQERELAKSYRSRQSFWGEQPERWFAAGLAPYQNFSVGSQQAYNYNSAGSKNIATDYLPAPYLQLHLTNRMYVLSEFQFNAPQSTPSLLLSQKSLTVPMSAVGYTESTYLRKLYYFNMPVSFYYSPVKNFYLGSGLQFSSFNSGLAYTEQRTANNSLVKSDNIKIKDDSLSSKITASEWRYLFDANYYVNRFMFGVRYNQALNNFINLNVNNTLPPVQARNQSIQFYIRYNIIMSDKRR